MSIAPACRAQVIRNRAALFVCVRIFPRQRFRRRRRHHDFQLYVCASSTRCQVSFSLPAVHVSQHNNVASYKRLVQADIDAGELSDASTVTSTSPRPSPVEVTNSATCSAVLPRQPGVKISENVTTITAASGADASFTDAGDKYEYRITISNTGNTWLSNVNISDLMFEDLACESNYTSSEARLVPGDSVVCTPSLTLEQTHIDNSCVDNFAEVS